MLLDSLQFGSGGTCVLHYEESEHWLYATWSGLIGDHEAMQGALSYLDKVATHPSAFLLNNNLALNGPWFNSAEWLEHAWLPQAQRLGLRYIAHVVQADKGVDILTLASSHQLSGSLELQLFYDLAEAKDWLHSCRHQVAPPTTASYSFTGKAASSGS
ncbi:hypothetical protein MTX78_14485 [Hymenobacter tibetensis]|uniref:STAS/SEC14 domain-containing protein n=1 Tax=Hymenobacter tibetensis TaxID=497967 RepID=A0ABY4CWE6_9BACT|nr:hypothetical protein [Hymenobacter tibetensis]UOG73331.1 hypothetical protein MTX78_14485 [Hymenobacter tibetensis]